LPSHTLSHLRVIDLTHYRAGPLCTKLMAGFGADVLKIERPQTGDKLRNQGPFLQDREGLEWSIPFAWLNTGKKSLTLNLKTEKGIDILKKLVQEADVLVENFSPRVMPGLGLTYHTLREINPGLVMASISNFGQTGPYRDYQAEEIQAQAMSGLMHMTGEPEKPPLQSGPAICQYSAGLHAYMAILLALFQRGDTREGQHIDVSVMECGLEHIELTLTNFLHTGNPAKRGGHIMALWDLYSCRNGYAAVISAPVRHWLQGAKIFQEPRLLDPKYRRAIDRIQHREALDNLIQPWLDAHDKKEVFAAGQEHGLAFGFLANLPEVLESPQHRDRQFFVELDHPELGRHRYCGAPYKMSLTPWESGRAPLLGEHDALIYGQELGLAEPEIQALRDEGVI
jgi:CoA:oxalate CoA-transferase